MESIFSRGVIRFGIACLITLGFHSYGTMDKGVELGKNAELLIGVYLGFLFLESRLRVVVESVIEPSATPDTTPKHRLNCLTLVELKTLIEKGQTDPHLEECRTCRRNMETIKKALKKKTAN